MWLSKASFGERMEAYLEVFRREPGTHAAGGPEWERRRRREAEGIPIPDGLFAELHAAGERARVPFAP